MALCVCVCVCVCVCLSVHTTCGGQLERPFLSQMLCSLQQQPVPKSAAQTVRTLPRTEHTHNGGSCHCPLSSLLSSTCPAWRSSSSRRTPGAPSPSTSTVSELDMQTNRSHSTPIIPLLPRPLSPCRTAARGLPDTGDGGVQGSRDAERGCAVLCQARHLREWTR